MPRSMVSLGILLAFAFAITWASLKLLLGSGPPSFTATAISLPRMVKIFPLAASFLSFLCLIFSNFECPTSFLSPFICLVPLTLPHAAFQPAVSWPEEYISSSLPDTDLPFSSKDSSSGSFLTRTVLIILFSTESTRNS